MKCRRAAVEEDGGWGRERYGENRVFIIQYFLSIFFKHSIKSFLALKHKKTFWCLGWLVDNSWIHQLADCQLADWTTGGLVNSRTIQLGAWTSHGLDNLWMPLATLRAWFSFFGHLLMFSCMCTSTYIALVIRLVVLCPRSLIMQLKQQILLLASSASCLDRELTSP